jgi:hypothetical protein
LRVVNDERAFDDMPDVARATPHADGGRDNADVRARVPHLAITAGNAGWKARRTALLRDQACSARGDIAPGFHGRYRQVAIDLGVQ